MKRNNLGFTLIEVLIALAILSIALTAVIRATSQNIQDTMYLQNKTIATWIGTDIINQARIGILKLPPAPDTLKKETTVLNQKWEWEGTLVATKNPKIKKMMVKVFLANNEAPITNLVSYVYLP